MNENSKQWYYTGDAYKTILEKFPESIYVPKAVFRLINIFHTKQLPWNDSIQLIREELQMWQEFILKYTAGEEYVLALLEIGYLYRVLFEITKDMDFQKDAIDVFKKIINNSPNSIHSAQAEVNLYEIENGETIYYW